MGMVIGMMKDRRVKCALFLVLCFCITGFSPRVSADEKLVPSRKLRLSLGTSFVLEVERKTKRISVGDPEIMDIRAITPKQILLNAKALGSTNLIVWFLNGGTRVYALEVTLDHDEILSNLKKLAPDADISLYTLNQELVVSGFVDDQDTLDRLLTVLGAYTPLTSGKLRNLIKLRGPQQVQLEARIAEVSTTGIKRLGLGFLLDRSVFGEHMNLGLFTSGTTSGTMSGVSSGGESASALSHTSELYSPFADAFMLALGLPDQGIFSILNILKSQGLARILARPTLVAMSGQPASFLVGGEFPVPVTQSGGGDAITTDFKEFGVLLNFIPTVIGKETISLQVSTSVSDIDFSTAVSTSGVSVPGVVQRGANTSVQLKDGQTLAIAGLLRENLSSSHSKLPFLGDIPLLGTLFSQKEYRKEETELIILVTPRLVKPLNPEDLPAEPEGMGQPYPSDLEFFLLGKVDGTHFHAHGAADREEPGFAGPVGFVR